MRLKIHPYILWSFSFFILALSCFGLYLWRITPSVTRLIGSNPETTAMMRYNEKYFKYETPLQWKWIKYTDISPNLIQAVIIVEDNMFYHHHGINWDMVFRTLKLNLRKGKIVRGGSTITQQLAKNLFLDPSPNYFRKIREAVIALRLEKTLSKVRILELYLNVIEWGPNIYGVEAASQHYFKHSALNLNIVESIRLASILSNPNLYSPFNDTHKVINKKRRYILKCMLAINTIDTSAYNQIKKELSLL